MFKNHVRDLDDEKFEVGDVYGKFAERIDAVFENGKYSIELVNAPLVSVERID